MSKFFLSVLILLIFFISGCVSSPKAELSADDTDVDIDILSNEDKTLNITLRVHNTGELAAQNVVVTAKANPVNEAGESVQIGSFTISGIPPKSEALAFIKWDTKTTYKDNMIRLAIDPGNSIEEPDKANNVVVFSYSIN
ncbi:MAG: CARDB domain-containing protein [Candidatus Methanoperedens sp.]